MSTALQLNCWVFGESAKRIFPIRIQNTETVGDLQEAIKRKKRAFDNVDADSLDLHQVRPVLLPAFNRLIVGYRLEGFHSRRPRFQTKTSNSDTR